MKNFLLLLIFISPLANAGKFSDWITPTRIDIDRGVGLMVYGSFTDKIGCTVNNRVYVKKDHAEFEKIYAAALTAFSAGTKIQLYLDNCEPATWYSTPDITYPTVNYGSVSIKK